MRPNPALWDSMLICKAFGVLAPKVYRKTCPGQHPRSGRNSRYSSGLAG